MHFDERVNIPFLSHGKLARQKACPHFTSSIHVAAQGRVNLIGEHTDYNESLMFIPMVIPIATGNDIKGAR